MNVNEISGPTGPSAANADRQVDRGLDKEAFMELLLLQMRSQDPLNPMDSAQMFNQMAQLSSLEQLWDIRELLSESNASQQLAEGSMLIGRHVEALSAQSGQLAGLVEEVKMIAGEVWLQIGNDQVQIHEVVSVQ